VTGVGDTVGQGLVKAARSSAVPVRVIGTDRAATAVGLAWVDRGYVIPGAGDEHAYLAAIRRVCRAEAVRLLLPGSETELLVLARNADALQEDTGAIVVASPADAVAVALDKLETVRFLERAGLAFPRYARIDDEEGVRRLVETVGFPLVAKPFRGTGGQGRQDVDGWPMLDLVRAVRSDIVLQERLVPDDEEYAVSVYSPRHGRPMALAYRREQILAGDTYRALVGSFPDVEAEGLRVAAALGASGPCDVQLRRTSRGPVTFEVNPRFSGGVAIRAHFGFNEVELALRDLVLGETVEGPRARSGRVLRYVEETYQDDEPPAPAAERRSEEGS